jgi:hypothetical protein
MYTCAVVQGDMRDYFKVRRIVRGCDEQQLRNRVSETILSSQAPSKSDKMSDMVAEESVKNSSKILQLSFLTLRGLAIDCMFE